MKNKGQSNLPLIFKSIVVVEIDDSHKLSKYNTVACTLLQTNKLLPQTYFKKSSNFKKIK